MNRHDTAGSFTSTRSFAQALYLAAEIRRNVPQIGLGSGASSNRRTPLSGGNIDVVLQLPTAIETDWREKASDDASYVRS